MEIIELKVESLHLKILVLSRIVASDLQVNYLTMASLREGDRPSATCRQYMEVAEAEP